MSQHEEDKDPMKAVPLDLARSQISTVRTVDGNKAPLVMSGLTAQPLRGMRVLTQGIQSSSGQNTNVPTIITTNIVPQALLKQDSGRTQIAGIISTQSQSQGNTSITLQRPAQITLSTTPVVATGASPGTNYHVPRGAAVVASLAAPRSNVGTVRAPMIVTAQTGQVKAHAFVRPPRTPSPAQGTAWLTTNSTSGNQIKGAPTVLSSPVRGATVTGKPQIVPRSQNMTQNVSSIRPGTAILHSAITIGQQGQIHSFKAGQGTSIQALGGAVTIAQVLPSRTQAVVYSSNATQFNPARLTVASTLQSQRQNQNNRTTQVNAPRLTLPIPASQQNLANRLITPQATILAQGARITTVPTQHNQGAIIGSGASRIVSTQPTVSISGLGRLSVAQANPVQVTSGNILAPTRISTLNLQSLVAVASSQQRALQGTGPKVITQPAQGTIHLTNLSTQLKTTPSIVSTSTRTINVPAAIVAQRPAAAVVSSQAIPIAKVFSHGTDQHQAAAASNVFIHTQVPNVSRRTSPSPSNNNIVQTNNVVPTTTVAAYTIASGTYFYDASGNYSVARSYGQQSTPFATISQNTQSIRPATTLNTHGLATNQQMRYNPVMVVEQQQNNRTQYNPAPAQHPQQSNEDQSQGTPQIKTTSSPRPSILRKRDHEGSSLKAAKNLNPLLSTLTAQLPPQQPPQVMTQGPQMVSISQVSPQSPPSRPDSRGNGHSSAGSTTISATSSPGLAEMNEDSNPMIPMNNKEDDDVKPPIEMSPRKKPRKQQLTGNDMDEHHDDMQFIENNSAKKEHLEDSDHHSDEPRDGAPEAKQVTTVRKPATASLLNSYRQTWKATHNHYLRYSDVKPKDERRPSIMDLANQYRVQEKVNGWKIHHLSTQMEDLAEQEEQVYSQLNELLKCTEPEETVDKDVNRINELIKGNLQRIKIINDGMIEAKTQIMKIFDHKVHVTDIINRCASKRNYKKRDKS